jgi:translation initiation factor 2 subunit 2
VGYEDLLKKAYEKMPKKAEEKKRFAVPVAVCELQGNKTLVKNFSELLTILRRDSNHFAKFLTKELAAPGVVQGNILILQRKVPRGMLQEKMEAYIKEFIYCKVCGEPDTMLMKEEKGTVLKCEACGARYIVREI